MTNFNSCLPGCGPAQIININMAFNNPETIQVLNGCGEPYSTDELQYAYSVDMVCWSCYMSLNDILENTVSFDTDFWVRIKVKGVVKGITINGEAFTDYNTSIAEGFEFTACSGTNNTNMYNPYLNMDCAISLQQQMTELVSCMFGIPIYYFKLSPNANSKDITFKEYALMDVESVKQIKLIIQDNQMPSSKPEFSDFGFDFQSDWETEISKGMFATAFGPTAQPMEGDLIYIPMMKRMWMVNSAYEEKKDALMWNATTFKVMLVKYQEKGSVDYGESESLISSFVKNKYEDLFGDEETVVAQTEAVSAPTYAANNLYPVYESDATRKYISCDNIDFKAESLYYQGTLISDNWYYFVMPTKPSQIVYQKQFCGEDGVISFIIKPFIGNYEGTLFECANLKLKIKQEGTKATISCINVPKLSVTVNSGVEYFIFMRWSKQLNTAELFAANYAHLNMPIYKLQSQHYYFAISSGTSVVSKYDIELVQDTKKDVIVHNFNGLITNVKVFDAYNDNTSEILQMYPTHAHLLINDTARKLNDLPGVSLR